MGPSYLNLKHGHCVVQHLDADRQLFATAVSGRRRSSIHTGGCAQGVRHPSTGQTTTTAAGQVIVTTTSTASATATGGGPRGSAHVGQRHFVDKYLGYLRVVVLSGSVIDRDNWLLIAWSLAALLSSLRFALKCDNLEWYWVRFVFLSR